MLRLVELMAGPSRVVTRVRASARRLALRRRPRREPPPAEVAAALKVVPALVTSQDWSGLLERLEPVEQEFESESPPEVFARLSLAYRHLGRLTEAEAILKRGRARFPDNLRLGTEWAQLAAAQLHWPNAASRYEAVLTSHGKDVAPVVYARLAIAYREDGAFNRAAATIQKGLSEHPGDMRLDIEWAQLAIAQRNWPEAIERIETILHNHPDAPPEVYARLTIAYREEGQYAKAGAVLVRARSMFPRSLRLETEWTQLAIAQMDWPEAITRLETLVADHPDTAPPEIYAKLSIAYRSNEDLNNAAEALERGWIRFPRHLRLDIEWAQLAVTQLDWPEAVTRLTTVIQTHPETSPPEVYTRLALAHRQLNEHDVAATIVQLGMTRHPEDAALASAWAQLAMIDQDWNEAIVRWQELLTKGEPDPAAALPPRGTELDWNEVGWLHLIDNWPTHPSDLRTQPSPALYTSIADALSNVNAPAHTTRILDYGLSHYPTSPHLKFATAADRLTSLKPGPGQPTPRHFVEAALTLPQIDQMDANGESLASFIAPQLDHGLPPIVRIRVPRGTTLEIETRAARHYTRTTVRTRIRQLSEQHQWPEISERENPMERLAHRLSAAYGRRFEELPFLAADALADAIYFVVYSELWGHAAMRRLARAIAAESSNEPVFLEISGTWLTYLNGYAETEFELLTLYLELRRRGVNAFLCEYVDHDTRPSSALTLRPNPGFMQARDPVADPSQTTTNVGVVPAGIRSVSSVIESLGSPLVYSSSSIVPEFAYERSYLSRVAPSSSFMPPRSLLPTQRIGLWPTTAVLSADDLLGAAEPVGVPIETSAPLGKDWLGWLAELLQGYLGNLAMRSYAEVASHRIEAAHIADHPYPESSTFARAVKARGGSVTVWPHSTNPAHIKARREGSVDVIHAVTRTGCHQWRARFPDAEIIHSPQLMLSSAVSNPPSDRNAPLAVVVIGGKNTLGAMPFIHQSAHEDSYRRFFAGLEDLQREVPLAIYYKPKGVDGENEAWLEQTVGDAAQWEPIIQHPLKISLPNAVFVSISVGSGALIEGMSRGIPCVIVKDFPARDYLALDQEVIPSGPTDEMLAIIRSSAHPDGMLALRESQLERYRRETTVAGSSRMD